MTKRVAIYGSGVYITIKTEDKYCGDDCAYKIEAPFKCVLFEKKLDTCLGGGPLRCASCLESEKQAQEGK